MKRINLFSFCFGIVAIIIILRFERLIEIFQFLFRFVELLVANPGDTINQVSLTELDFLLIPLILIMSIVLIFSNRNKLKETKLNFTILFSIIILLILLLAPLLINQFPERINNIRVAKLLPPMSVKKIIEIKSLNTKNDFFEIKNRLTGIYESENVFIVDSINVTENKIFQKNHIVDIDKKMKDKNTFIETSTIKFILGTDELGRDVYSRLIYGIRLSIFIAAISAIISVIIASLIGFISGFYGGVIGGLFNKIIDLFVAFPMVFLIIILLALFGNSLMLLILILGLTGWMTLAKIIRGEISIAKQKDFITSDLLLGYSKPRLFFLELLPNILPPVAVNIIFLLISIIIVESSLSFLGLGVQNEFVTIGGMINEGQKVISNSWWVMVFPCVVLIICLLTINSIGRYIEIKVNPKLKR